MEIRYIHGAAQQNAARAGAEGRQTGQPVTHRYCRTREQLIEDLADAARKIAIWSSKNQENKLCLRGQLPKYHGLIINIARPAADPLNQTLHFFTTTPRAAGLHPPSTTRHSPHPGSPLSSDESFVSPPVARRHGSSDGVMFSARDFDEAELTPAPTGPGLLGYAWSVAASIRSEIAQVGCGMTSWVMRAAVGGVAGLSHAVPCLCA